MTREEVLENYDVDESSRIKSPGKFEGEMLYVPAMWEWVMEGWADEHHDDVNSVSVQVMPEDEKEFPELRTRTSVRMYETEQGFVTEISEGEDDD